MKTVIYYFSSTGNSLALARSLAVELKDTSVIPISKAIKGEIDFSVERIGLVFPVYMWGMPSLVVDFVNKFKNSGSIPYIFTVVTYGGMPGNTVGQLKGQLKSFGVNLACGFAVRMPGNYTPMYEAWSEKKQKELFDSSVEKIKSIAAYISNDKKGRFEKSFLLINVLLSGLFYKISMPRIHTLDKDFWADNSCNGCGICKKVCPVNNIEIVANKPVWQHKCEHCLACLQWCPLKSVQFGKSTPGKKRYRHPDVSVNDFFS